ncbi:outer membrane beta-barrel protein [Hymenobacter sp. APR13]|uniref:outer membrane beta-barrel protein n=1 Tax=Hymenobacter sp. APR13 TaxID=1356852 RepID=UPI0009DF3720|nr:outer membrane beta-barrel protein [Hymenobacter sp. APR13]
MLPVFTLLAALSAPAPIAASRDSLAQPAPRRWTWYAGPTVGLAKPTMQWENNFPYAGYYETGQVAEPLYLLGEDMDAKLRPMGGLQLGLESPGRRWALHAEGTARRFGGYRQQFNTGHPDFPTKTYSMQATALTATLGVRYQLPVGQQWRLFAGAGWSVTKWANVQSEARYDGVASRELDGIALPVSGSFMQGLNPAAVSRQASSSYRSRAGGVYAEAGAHYRRWTLAVGYRRNHSHSLNDVSSAAHRQESRLTGQLMGFGTADGYYATPRTRYVAVSWRLFDGHSFPHL